MKITTPPLIVPRDHRGHTPAESQLREQLPGAVVRCRQRKSEIESCISTCKSLIQNSQLSPTDKKVFNQELQEHIQELEDNTNEMERYHLEWDKLLPEKEWTS